MGGMAVHNVPAGIDPQTSQLREHVYHLDIMCLTFLKFFFYIVVIQKTRGIGFMTYKESLVSNAQIWFSKGLSEPALEAV